MRGIDSFRVVRSMISLAAVVSVCACTSAGATGGMLLDSAKLSPDASRVVFQYHDQSSKVAAVGLLDLATDALTFVPNPKGKQFGYPSFSEDGKRIFAAMGCVVDCGENEKYETQIVVIDPDSGQIRQITEGPGYRIFPIFQPGSENALVVARRILIGSDGKAFAHGAYELMLVSPKDHSETPVLDEPNGFSVYISWPSFVGPSDVIFSGIAPKSTGLREAVLALGKGSRQVATVAYRLSFGGLPELLPENGGPMRPGQPDLSNISASKDGQRIAFIHLSRMEPETKGVGFNYELFVIENGETKQVTNVKTHIGAAHISYDGRFIAFLADETRRKTFDLFILNVALGEVKAIHLKERLPPRL